MSCSNCGAILTSKSGVCVFCGAKSDGTATNELSPLDSASGNSKPQNQTTNTILFIAGTIVLFAVSVILILALHNPDGSDGWLFTANNDMKQNTVIGLVLPALDEDYCDTFSNHISSVAAFYGWDIDVITTSGPGGEQEALDTLIARGVSAVIIDPMGLDEEKIQELDTICSLAMIPCIMLLNEGERYDCCSSSVWYDLRYMGIDMAHNSKDGATYIIAGDSQSVATRLIKDGLLREPHYGIAANAGIKVLGIAYVNEYQSAETLVTDLLEAYPEIRTLFILDPNVVDRVLSVCEEEKFEGHVYCYTNKTELSGMHTSMEGYTVEYEYFSLQNSIYHCVLAIADQLEYELEPQYYTMYPYVW